MNELKQIGEYKYEINRSLYPEMRVPGVIWADEVLIKSILSDNSIRQLAQAAALPGVVQCALAMPDIHQGYGLPIGGVLAMDAEKGMISPGATGYDINCGVRLAVTGLRYEDLKPDDLEQLLSGLYQTIPVGVGSTGRISVSGKKAAQVMEKGSAWAISEGYGEKSDLEYTEAGGQLEGANPDMLSPRAISRGKNQLGTLGAGNHFIEVQQVERIYDEAAAESFGLFPGQITLMIHTGSRGLGHQVCTDYVRIMQACAHKYGIKLPDRQLACAPIDSPEGKEYLSAMRCAANYAWANRQCLMILARDVFEKYLSISPNQLKFSLLYDVAHNIIKMEEHMCEGKKKLVAVHRKGATRSFPAGHPELPDAYRQTGQPVLIPGDMGSGSYILKGNTVAMQETFGSTNHGAGRVLSRKAAKQRSRGRSIVSELKEKGVLVRAGSLELLGEEMPEAYKDINRVVEVVHQAKIATKVARLKPLCVIKG